MSIDDIPPAIAPLHPPKPEPAIVAGHTWQRKRARAFTGKHPTLKIERVTAAMVEGRREYGGWVSMRVSTFRRDWEPT